MTESSSVSLFQLFDKGHKGYITHDELQSILRNAFAISKEDVTRLFCEVDTNHDGKITYGIASYFRDSD